MNVLYQSISDLLKPLFISRPKLILVNSEPSTNGGSSPDDHENSKSFARSTFHSTNVNLVIKLQGILGIKIPVLIRFKIYSCFTNFYFQTTLSEAEVNTDEI